MSGGGQLSMRFDLGLFLFGLTAVIPGRGLRRAADVDLPGSPCWEVIPELRSDGHTLTLDDALQALPNRLQLNLEIDGSVVHIELHHNQHLLPDSHAIHYYLPDGTAVTDRGPGPVNCYYHGKLVGSDGPWSSLSLCSGLRGTIILAPDQRFSIEPVPERPFYKHIVRRIEKKRNSTCDTPGDETSVKQRRRRALLSLTDPTPPPNQPDHRVKSDVVSEVKYVELVMVADDSEFKMLNQDLKSLHVRMLEIANQMDTFYRILDIRVVLVMVEVWSQGDKVNVSRDPAETLNRFLSWREEDLVPRVHHDNAQLLTGVSFTGSSVGMATMNSICTADRSGGVTTDHSVSVLMVASTMAHELGHNLGLYHDTVDETCGQPRMGKQWIMTPSTGFMPGLEFSSCSRKDLMSSLRQGGGSCLFNVPSPDHVYGEPMCGNLQVEKGEQCDCGLLQECTDPCCNASSCLLVAGAQCSSDGLCCEQCKIKPSGTLCREPLGECDLSEYCNGTSPHCPANVYFQNGEPCGNGQARCYQGECQTLQKQCQHLWGPGSSPAPDSCFAKVNMRGDEYGNCGRATNGSYLPCAPRDILCGSIQCLGGRDLRLLGASAKMITVPASVNGSEISCRGTYFDLGEDVWDFVLVKTGTVCGQGKVCMNQKCGDAAELTVGVCSGCGGHGVCNSNGNCHCAPGWAPPDCGSSGHGGSLDSGPVVLGHARSSMASTVVPVLIILCLLVVLLFFCYLKRGFLQRQLSRVSNTSRKCQSRVPQTNSQPRPQRPPPPHWSQSTELQVMSASNQCDCEGFDRPDPPLKPLPPDPVHKRLQAAAQDRPPAPTRPLPVDPLPRRAQVPCCSKPPLPKKPLPLRPIQQCQDPLLGVPARHAPPPPYIRRAPKV